MAQEPSQSNAVTSKPGSLRAAKIAMFQQPAPSNPPDAEKIISQPTRPKYGEIHKHALPIMTYPLPTFVPHNPLSYLHIAFTLIKHYLYPPTSHTQTCEGHFDPATSSVHVTNPKTVRALWEMGFFGKGSLSRSEPTWLDQEKKRLGLVATVTSEEVTDRRRMEREKLKRERARLELEAVEEQRRKEASVASEQPSSPNGDVDLSTSSVTFSSTIEEVDYPEPPEQPNPQPTNTTKPEVSAETVDIEVTNQEHLQLTLEEAFFLMYALGCLNLSNISDYSTPSLLQLFRQHSHFPPLPPTSLSPDDSFLLQYVVYHHFRSRGWVVRDGIKFAVDYLLYERGPVFKHAAFAIMIVPSYSHAYWQQKGIKETAVQRRKGRRDWTWLHSVNRVQTHVIKTLVLVYVDVPPPNEVVGEDVGAILGKYKVREFCISRWSANRNRD